MFYINIDKDTEKRYAPEKLMRFDKSGVYDVLDAFFITELARLPMAGTYVVVEDEGRPDLVSYRLYGSTEYWWMLMLYNNLITPSQLKAGTAVKYPIIDTLETLYGGLATQARTVVKKSAMANAPATRAAIGDPDSLGRVIPSGSGDTNAMLLRAYASFAAQKYNLAYAVIDDFETTEGINLEKSVGLGFVPFRVDMSVGELAAPVLLTVEHLLLEKAACNALHIAMLPDMKSLSVEFSLDGGVNWEVFNEGLVYTKGSRTVTLRFTYRPAAGEPLKRGFNGYVIVHD